MSKERLEELKDKYSKAKVIEHLNGIDIIAVDIEDIDELIKTSVEKDERVEELIKLVNYHQEKQKQAEDKNEPYRHQNKRYREAINNINEKSSLFGANEQVYEAIQDAIKTLEGDPHD